MRTKDKYPLQPVCISYLLLHNNLLQNSVALKQQCKLSLSFYRAGLTRPSGSRILTRLSSGSGRGCSHPKAQLGKDSQLTSMIVGKIRVLGSFCNEGLSSSLPVTYMMPSVPCYMGVSVEWVTTWQLSPQMKPRRIQERNANKMEVTDLVTF